MKYHRTNTKRESKSFLVLVNSIIYFFENTVKNSINDNPGNHIFTNMKRVFAYIFLFFVSSQIFGQASIKGTVTDASNGELLLGATILIENTTKGTMTDFDGNYLFENLPFGTYKIIARFLAYKSIEKEVTLQDDSVITVDFNLESAVTAIGEEAIVEVRQNKSNNLYMENIKKRDNSMIDYVSNQQIKKSGDSNVSSAIKRISGVYTLGNFVVVRGLSDRYIRTVLNGAEIPSLDPKRNSVSMDIFPTNLIDNLIVVKTVKGDLPANYTGAYINVQTKDFPDVFTFNYSSSIGINTNASFNENFITSVSGNTEFFGWDNGHLSIPSIVNNEEILPLQFSNYYDALINAGYEDQLTELGILSANDIGGQNGQTSINEIINEIDGIQSLSQIQNYLSDNNQQLNQTLSQQTQAFENSWEPVSTTPLFNFSKSFSFGNKTQLFNRTFGYNFGFQYKLSNQFYENGNTGRYQLTGVDTTKTELDIQRQLNDQRGTRNVYTSALLNLGYEVTEKDRLSFTYMPNMSGINDARYQNGVNPSDAVGLGQQQTQQRYLERQLHIFQLRGSHELTNPQHKISWSGSYTTGKQGTPDLRLFINSYEELPAGLIYFDQDGTNITEDAIALLNDGENLEEYFPNYTIEETTSGDLVYSIQDNLYPSPTRFFREMSNTTLDLKLNYSLPILKNISDQNLLSFGISHVRKTRDYSENRYSFVSNGINFDGSPQEYFSSENMNIIPGTSNFIYLRDDTDRKNSYEAIQAVSGAYTMVDVDFNELVKLNLGVRAELTDMLLESQIIKEEVLLPEQEELYRGTLNLIDVLPSINLSYKINENDLSITNLRFSMSQSVARPLFREKAPFSVFDFEIQEQQTGNTDLTRTKISNFDLRLEKYPNLGEIISASLFYKYFQNPIEQVIISTASNTEITWKNVNQASLLGCEFELKKNLRFISENLKNYSVAINTTLIKSATDIEEDELEEILATDIDHPETRPIFGQSPYIINSMINYTNDSIGLSINASFNVSGEKLVLITPGGTPDVYDQPRPSLDLSINYKLSEKINLNMKARNLLDPEYRQIYSYNNQEYDFQSFNRGRLFSFGISYNFISEN